MIEVDRPAFLFSRDARQPFGTDADHGRAKSRTILSAKAVGAELLLGSACPCRQQGERCRVILDHSPATRNGRPQFRGPLRHFTEAPERSELSTELPAA